MIKNFFLFFTKKIIQIFLKVKYFRRIAELVAENLLEEYLSIKHDGVVLKFSSPNNLSRWRIKTFSKKEPETLDWINNFRSNSVFWDIGANIGIYSCYAAKKKSCKVYAFEPSVFNLDLLAKNIC